jgi:hypothetical protein
MLEEYWKSLGQDRLENELKPPAFCCKNQTR